MGGLTRLRFQTSTRVGTVDAANLETCIMALTNQGDDWDREKSYRCFRLNFSETGR